MIIDRKAGNCGQAQISRLNITWLDDIIYLISRKIKYYNNNKYKMNDKVNVIIYQKYYNYY